MHLVFTVKWNGISRYESSSQSYLGNYYWISFEKNEDNWVGIFLHPQMRALQTEITLSWSFGILNENGNICRRQKIDDHTFKRTRLLGYGYTKWMEKSTLEKYKKNNEYKVIVDFSDVKMKSDLAHILTKLYERVTTDESVEINRRLEDEIKSLGQKNIDLMEENALLKTQIASIIPREKPHKEEDVILPNDHECPKFTIDTIRDFDISKLEFKDLKNLSDVLFDLNKRVSEEINSHSTCKICMENDNNAVMNCGHIICMDCSKKIEICPHCREKVTNVIQTY